MKVGLYIPSEKESSRYVAFRVEISNSLSARGIECVIGEGCLCDKPDLTGLDVVVAHPHYNNKNGCWDRINKILAGNRNVHFFLFAMLNSKREEFFGDQPNLTYIKNRGFFSNPLTFLESKCKEA